MKTKRGSRHCDQSDAARCLPLHSATQLPRRPNAQTSPITEVVVTGLRQSIQTAQEIKQNAEVIVDSISAVDISALPDRSVTEALQRIPGVSIDHLFAPSDTNRFSAEGSGVTVRGLTQVRSELNGRDVFSARNTRGLSFEDVPSELMVGCRRLQEPVRGHDRRRYRRHGQPAHAQAHWTMTASRVA